MPRGQEQLALLLQVSLGQEQKYIYCSQECQRKAWPNHKKHCNKEKPISNLVELPLQDVKALLKLFKHYHIDISKIIHYFDPNKANEFKKRNAYYQSQNKHNHTVQGGGCCSVGNKMYIPEGERNALEKAIFEVKWKFSNTQKNLKLDNLLVKVLYVLVGPTTVKEGGWLNSNLPKILEMIGQAYGRIMDKGKAQGFECDDYSKCFYLIEKDILGKCMMECVNKMAYDEVRKKLVKEEQSYSKQPLLIAHPSHIKQLIKQSGADTGDKSDYQILKESGYSLQQLDPTDISKLVEHNWVVKEGFIRDETGMLKRTVERLELMEIEGRFDISRQGLLLPPEERPRNDKTFQFNMGNLEGIGELRYLEKFYYLYDGVPTKQ